MGHVGHTAWVLDKRHHTTLASNQSSRLLRLLTTSRIVDEVMGKKIGGSFNDIKKSVERVLQYILLLCEGGSFFGNIRERAKCSSHGLSVILLHQAHDQDDRLCDYSDLPPALVVLLLM